MMKRAEKGQELEDLNLQMMHRLVSSTPSQAIFPSQTAGRGPMAACARAAPGRPMEASACCERLPRRCSSALDS
jgi:hypothetical protein